MLAVAPTVSTSTDVKATTLENQSYQEMQVSGIDEVETLSPNSTVKNIVSKRFATKPELIKIAYCESRLRQFGKDGNVLRGIVTPEDVGVMQINEGYHGERAKKLGIDLHTIEGNMQFAELLYNEQGSQPWSASKPCWSKA